MNGRAMWIALALLMVAPEARSEVEITVYNQDLALVKDTRKLIFEQGVTEIPFTDVASAIDPTTVTLTVPDSTMGVRLLEQNYRYDLVSADKILANYLGRTIRALSKQGRVSEGKLLSADATSLTIEYGDSGLTTLTRAELANVEYPSLPAGMLIRPTLVWKLQSELSRAAFAEVSYLTGRIGWHAEYVAVLDSSDSSLRLSGWASIDNQSGATYVEARINLVAGEVNRIREELRPAFMIADPLGVRAGITARMEERPLFEYHLYTLSDPSTLHNNETKQLALFQPATVRTDRTYTYEDGKVRVSLEFLNSPEAGLGIPLPRGKFRVMKADSDGALQFIGEDRIAHTAMNEKVRARLGNAFDVVGERKHLSLRKISGPGVEEEFEIRLRNHKSTDVTVAVIEHLIGDWTITETTVPYEKSDYRTAEWRVTVPANGESTIGYTVRQKNID